MPYDEFIERSSSSHDDTSNLPLFASQRQSAPEPRAELSFLSPPTGGVTHTSREANYYANRRKNAENELVMNYLRQAGESCITETAEALGMQRSTISRVYNTLHKRGLITSTGVRQNVVTEKNVHFYKLAEVY